MIAYWKLRRSPTLSSTRLDTSRRRGNPSSIQCRDARNCELLCPCKRSQRRTEKADVPSQKQFPGNTCTKASKFNKQGKRTTSTRQGHYNPCQDKRRETKTICTLHTQELETSTTQREQRRRQNAYNGTPTIWAQFARQRLNASVCESCGKEGGYFEVHHVRKLKDLQGKQWWEQVMSARKRKTLILCNECHILLHAGKLSKRQKEF